MSSSNCRLSMMNIVQKLNKIVSEESESLEQTEEPNNDKNNQLSFLDLLRSIINKENNPVDSGKKSRTDIPELRILNNHWAESMGNCSLELVFLQCTVWLKNLVETTDHVPSDELMKMVEGILDEKFSKQLPPLPAQNPTTPQRTWPGINKQLQTQPIIIPSSQEAWSQQSADLFDSPPLLQNQMTMCDSGVESMNCLAKKTSLKPTENDEPPLKKIKSDSLFISSGILSSFLDNNPFNNIGLQVIRVLFSALERKDTVKRSIEYSREIKDAVDAIIGFIQGVEKEEEKYCGYVVFCIPNALDAIRRICFEHKEEEEDDDDVEEMERMVLMSIVLELCNIKEICVKTIKMAIQECHKLANVYDDKSKPLPAGFEFKIRELDYCLNLVVDKYCKKFFTSYTESRSKINKNYGKEKSSENLNIVLIKEFKEIYNKNRLIFPQFAFSMQRLWRRLVDQLKSN